MTKPIRIKITDAYDKIFYIDPMRVIYIGSCFDDHNNLHRITMTLDTGAHFSIWVNSEKYMDEVISMILGEFSIVA